MMNVKCVLFIEGEASMWLLLDTKVAVSSKHTTRITSIGKLSRTLNVSRRDEV